MNTLPDAPWIREAERYGMPESDPPICPICCKEADRFYFEKDGREIVGCDNCIDWKDAWNAETDGTTLIR